MDSRGRGRTVVLRWRSFLNTPSDEITTLNRFPQHEPIRGREFNSLINNWRRGGTPEDAVDIMDAGIACGSRQLALEGAKKLLFFGKNYIKFAVLDRAEAIVHRRSNSRHAPTIPIDEAIEEHLYFKIHRLKIQLSEYQKNPLAHIEVARLYTRLAEFDKAAYHVNIALLLAPNDRVVLRTSTRFLTMVDGSRDALANLWRSELIRYDPWIQSAELSAASIGKVAAKFAPKSAKKVIASSRILRDTSELVAGWATKHDTSSLSTKNSFKILGSLISNSTENAVAQTIWFADNVGKDLNIAFPNLKIKDDAHEALSMAFVDARDYERALHETIKWFLDQPFQARAAIQLCFITFVHYSDFSSCLKYAEAGMRLHPKDWLLINFCCLASARIGDFVKAESYLKKFEREGSGEDAKIFFLAARGMLEFQRGNFAAGVEFYLSAVREGRRSGRPDLVVNAAIYLLEMACEHNISTPGEVTKISNQITISIKAMSPGKQKSLTDIWSARRKYIDNFIMRDTVGQLVLPLIEAHELLREIG
jgi:hypothetical protein